VLATSNILADGPTNGSLSGTNPSALLAFVGGAVQFISEEIEPRVYAQLMTSNWHRSDLHVGDVWDPRLPALSEGDY
jgi:hypothetical protein